MLSYTKPSPRPELKFNPPVRQEEMSADHFHQTTFYPLSVVLRIEAENPQELVALGRTSTLTEEHEKAAKMFITSLYGRPGCASLNNLRAEKATLSINIASQLII